MAGSGLGSLARLPLSLLSDWRWFNVLAGLILAAEAVLGAAIILKVPYTEIDWIAYMQEVGGYLSGELDYTKLGGGTGPLVYPAGFVYLFAGLRLATDDGENVLRGQWIFLGFYLILMALVLAIYKRAGRGAFPPWVVLLLLPTKRVHSIFMLRLFNDGLSVLLMYIAVLMYTRRRWTLGSLWFSLAISIKMNILLFLPAVGIILLRNTGILHTAAQMLFVIALQGAIGYEFLAAYPKEYLSRAFELSRVFFFKWTVNWKFLPEEVFVGKPLAHALLACTFVFVFAFAYKWCRPNGGLGSVFGLTSGRAKDSPRAMVLALFASQLVGVVFARTLHYQFYSWYFHTLPFLLWHTRLPTIVRVGVMLGIEVAFNVFPATPWSSGLLQLCHVVLLAALFVAPIPAPVGTVAAADGTKDLPSKLLRKAGGAGAVTIVGADSAGVELEVRGVGSGWVSRRRVPGPVSIEGEEEAVAAIRKLGSSD